MTLKERIDAKKLDQSVKKQTDGYILIPMTVYDILDEAKKDLNPELCEHSNEDGTETPKVLIDLTKWVKWFGEIDA